MNAVFVSATPSPSASRGSEMRSGEGTPALGLTEEGDVNLVGLVVALVCAMVGLAVANAHREDA
jgi:hypothetical protein